MLKHFLSIDVFLKSPNIITSRTSKNPTTALHSETTKTCIILD